MERQPSKFFIYILRCADNSIYVGHTEDIDQRLTAHNKGEGAAWTAKRRPIELVYQESHDDLLSAVRREAQIEKWSRTKKGALIAVDLDQLRTLSKRKV